MTAPTSIDHYEVLRVSHRPEEHMKFHIWYLKENGWIQRIENGMLAITVTGVDWVLEHGGPGSSPVPLLKAANGSGNGAHPTA
jgi:hypothetical protein